MSTDEKPKTFDELGQTNFRYFHCCSLTS